MEYTHKTHCLPSPGVNNFGGTRAHSLYLTVKMLLAMAILSQQLKGDLVPLYRGTAPPTPILAYFVFYLKIINVF